MLKKRGHSAPREPKMYHGRDFCTDLLVLCTLTLCCVYFKASPPKFINVEDVMRLADGVTDMALAHEIAISSEFRLEQIQANPDR